MEEIHGTGEGAPTVRKRKAGKSQKKPVYRISIPTSPIGGETVKQGVWLWRKKRKARKYTDGEMRGKRSFGKEPSQGRALQERGISKAIGESEKSEKTLPFQILLQQQRGKEGGEGNGDSLFYWRGGAGQVMRVS